MFEIIGSCCDCISNNNSNTLLDRNPDNAKYTNSVENLRSIVYFDPKTLTRDSMVRWLAAKLPEFQMLSVSSSDEVLWLGQQRVDMALVLVNIGAQKIYEPELFQQLQSFTEELGDVPVAVLTDVDDQQTIAAAVACGLHGLILTTMAGSVVQEVVRLLCAGGTYATTEKTVSAMENMSDSLPNRGPAARLHLLENSTAPASSAAVLATTALALPHSAASLPPPSQGFTPRQMQILTCLKRGLANKMIAYELGMCESTVKIHVRNIMKKLAATNRTQVVSMTWHLGDPMQLRSASS